MTTGVYQIVNKTNGKLYNVTHQEAAMYFHRKNLLKEFREVGDEITRRAA